MIFVFAHFFLIMLKLTFSALLKRLPKIGVRNNTHNFVRNNTCMRNNTHGSLIQAEHLSYPFSENAKKENKKKKISQVYSIIYIYVLKEKASFTLLFSEA